MSRPAISRTELAAAVAERADLPPATCKAVIDALLEEVTYQLAKGNPVGLYGFGALTIRRATKRTVISVSSGQPVQTKPRNRVTFRAGRNLLAAVNKEVRVLSAKSAGRQSRREEAKPTAPPRQDVPDPVQAAASPTRRANST